MDLCHRINKKEKLDGAPAFFWVQLVTFGWQLAITQSLYFKSKIFYANYNRHLQWKVYVHGEKQKATL